MTKLSAEDAATFIHHGQTVGFSGFTPAGTAKAIPLAIADRAMRLHGAGIPYQIGVLTGASTGDKLDGALARAEAISFRTPYQSDPTLRKQINKGQTRFFDMHLSMLPQAVRYGFLGPVHWAVIEACEVTDDGRIYVTSAVGCSPTFCHSAEKILVEVNKYHPRSLEGMHDIYEPEDPPSRRAIPIYRCSDRIGLPHIQVDPKKIVGVVECDYPDDGAEFAPPTDITRKIGQNVADFLANEMQSGRVPKAFLPIQSGVGDIANSVLFALGAHPDIPPFEMYTEVLQDSVIDLLKHGHVKFASTCSLTLSQAALREVYDNLGWFRQRMLMRPQEITNHPEVIRRLGLISMNTAIEVDVFGNVNSTHVMGKQMMNGIGGSGDFTRNAYLSIFSCPSTAKNGKISTIVPLVTHMDHSEHSVQVVATEQGVADLRGKDPLERARLIVENCAHPDFRESLTEYLDNVGDSHSPFTLGAAFSFHQQFLKTGDMRGVDFGALEGAATLAR